MRTDIVMWARRIFWVIVAAVAVYAAYQSRAQFLLWHADAEGAARLLPPYHGMGYFVRYAAVHFWLRHIIAFVVAGIFFAGARLLNARRGGMLFEEEESYFIAMGIFAVGHPAWIFYLCFVFVAYFLLTLTLALMHGAQARISFYYFWLPCAAITVFFSGYLRAYAWYVNLLI